MISICMNWYKTHSSKKITTSPSSTKHLFWRLFVNVSPLSVASNYPNHSLEEFWSNWNLSNQRLFCAIKEQVLHWQQTIDDDPFFHDLLTDLTKQFWQSPVMYDPWRISPDSFSLIVLTSLSKPIVISSHPISNLLAWSIW